MALWTCPDCEREFGRARQGHVCVPGCTVEDTFRGRPPARRAAYEAIIDHLRGLGDFHEDAVRVGVFLKRQRKFAEVRPMARALSVELVLRRSVEDPRVLRRLRTAGDRTVHVIRLQDAGDVDEQIQDWLTEAFLAAG